MSPVHKNHFLLAALPFEQYRREFVSRFVAANPSVSTTVDRNQAARTYRWDLPEVAEFKYLLNFVVADVERESILDALFEEHLGDETAFARELYFSWEDARAMQAAGMVMGGHSHGHAPLPTLPASALHSDLTLCAAHLHRRLHSQPLWPFSYPYGRVSDEVVAVLRQLDFCCGFTTQVGRNTAPITDPFLIRRIDPKDVTRPQSVIAVAAS